MHEKVQINMLNWIFFYRVDVRTWQTVILYHRSKVSVSSVVADLSDDIA